MLSSLLFWGSFVTTKSVTAIDDLRPPNNVTITEEESVLFIERKTFFTAQESLAFFQEEEGGESQAQAYIDEIVSFFVQQGSISQEEWDAMKEKGIFDTQFLEALQADAG